MGDDRFTRRHEGLHFKEAPVIILTVVNIRYQDFRDPRTTCYPVIRTAMLSRIHGLCDLREITSHTRLFVHSDCGGVRCRHCGFDYVTVCVCKVRNRRFYIAITTVRPFQRAM
jgi:hypothetical protein